MVIRLSEFLIVTLWLVSMTWLVARDAIPRWFAQAPPQSASVSWIERNGAKFQYGIYDQSGLRRGTSWSVYQVNQDTVARKDLLALEGFGMVKQLIIESDLTFLNQTELVSVEIEIKGAPSTITLRGERQGPKFAFELKIGSVHAYDFVLDTQAAQTLCDVIKPFSSLPDLQVGQAWKIQVIDPFSLIQQGAGSRLKSVLVTVTGQESILIQGRPRLCFVVESQGTRGWVDQQGRVLRQIVEVPGLGQLEIREQAFQQEKYDEMIRKAHGIGRNGRRRGGNR